jgi:hypothetical protein
MAAGHARPLSLPYLTPPHPGAFLGRICEEPFISLAASIPPALGCLAASIPLALDFLFQCRHAGLMPHPSCLPTLLSHFHAL